MSDANEIRKQKIATIAKWGLGLAGAVIISPIIFLAVKGLIGFAIAGIVGIAIINFAPVISMKFANWKVKAIVNEAQDNPIETMTNLLVQKRAAFNRFKTSVEDAATATKNFEQKTIEFSKKFPHRAAEFQAQLDNMKRLVQQKKAALKEADASLDAGEMKLVEMRAYWDMSQAAQAANKAAGMDTGDVFEKLKADTAVDAVFESMNKAFAQLEVAAALGENDVPALQNNPSQIIDVIEVQERVKVRA